jgi:hypothetical protein
MDEELIAWRGGSLEKDFKETVESFWNGTGLRLKGLNEECL